MCLAVGHVSFAMEDPSGTISFTADGLSQTIAQLVPVDKRVRIVKVDINRSRLEVTETDKEKTMLYVVIDGYTKVTYQGKPISWTTLKKGQLLRVKGGLRIDGKIRAKDIYLIRKEVK
jgi:hypothetical protein